MSVGLVVAILVPAVWEIGCRGSLRSATSGVVLRISVLAAFQTQAVLGWSNGSGLRSSTEASEEVTATGSRSSCGVDLLGLIDG